MSLSAAYKQHWTEPRVDPLVMDDKEVLDWLSEYCEQVIWNRATPQYNEEFSLYCDGIRTSAPTIRQAVCLAAGKQKEDNQ